MRKKFFVVFSLLLVLTVAFSAVAPAAAQPAAKGKGGNVSDSPNGVYIVQMAGMPVVAYKGGIDGLKATAPKIGQKIDVTSPAVVEYVSYLDAKHDEALAKAGGGEKLYSYRYSFNGFAAKLTMEQANKLAVMDGVIAVSSDELLTLDTSSTPGFLGLSDPGGLWEKVGGVGSAGEGVVVGIVDGGIWPES